ncbi:MAG: hypothetical protein H6619_00790 [Deltaproteobacteria bacterium]|nr:hypothetical protein [Deltaproteobacteria bacterium]
MTLALKKTKSRSSRALIKDIFNSDNPEAFTQGLPAQSAYLLVRTLGAESAGDLISLLSREQYQLCLDFDLWHKDRINQAKFWEWLQSTDEENDLAPLRKFISSIDLKILAFFLGQHLETAIFDEPTEEPPAPQWYTPDKGYTWVGITLEDPDKHRLLGKLLAFIFEGNPELFYQLISIPNVSTPSELEEGAYQDKQKRLQSEGIPDDEQVHQITSPLPLVEVLHLLNQPEANRAIEPLPIIEPLIYRAQSLQPLEAFLTEAEQELSDSEFEIFQSEFTLIVNAAVVKWNFQIEDYSRLQDALQQIRGILNIGLEKVGSASEKRLLETYQALGLQRIFRVGVQALNELSSIANGVSKQSVEQAVDDTPTFSILACARETIPVYPLFLNDDGSFSETEGKLLEGQKPFERVAEIELVKDYLKKRFAN